MTNKDLAHAITQMESVVNSATDISNRITSTEGVFEQLRSIGLDTRLIQRDAISLTVHLEYVLKFARETLALWQDAQAVAEMKYEKQDSHSGRDSG